MNKFELTLVLTPVQLSEVLLDWAGNLKSVLPVPDCDAGAVKRSRLGYVSGHERLVLGDPSKLSRGVANQCLQKVMVGRDGQTREQIWKALKLEFPKNGLKETSAGPTISGALKVGGVKVRK